MGVQCGSAALITGVSEIALDLGPDRLFVPGPGIGDPFNEVGEFIDAFRSWPKPDPIVASAWRGV